MTGSWKRRYRNQAVMLLVLASTFLLGLPKFAAAQSVFDESSLKFVPADAAFYTSSLRHREMFDAFVKSRAYAELAATPFAKMIEAAFIEGFTESGNGSPEDVWANMEEVMGEEQLANLVDFLIDISSHEMFVYGGPDFVVWADVVSKGLASPALDTLADDSENLSEQQRAMLLEQVEDLLDEQLHRLKIPDLVIGFRVEDPELARKHVELMHAGISLGMLGGDVPMPIRTGYRRFEIGEANWLSLRLKGSQLPIDDLKADLDGDDPFSAMVGGRLLDHAAEQEFMVGIGMYDDYLMISIGDSLEHVESLANGDKLADRVEFEKLKPYAEEAFVGIYYGSDALAKVADQQTAEEVLGDLAEVVIGAVAEELDDPEAFTANVRADAERLGEQIDTVATPPAAILGFSFMTDRGFESMNISWAQSPLTIGDRPLSILDHIGDEPFLFHAAHTSASVESFEQLQEWGKRIDWYLGEYGPTLMDESDFEDYLEFRQHVSLYLGPFMQATVESLLPAVEGGETAFVIDLNNKKDQWVPFAPPAPLPLPLPELALICSIKDRDQFLAAMSEYDRLAHELFAEIEANSGEDFPEELVFPAYTQENVGGADVFYYPFDELEAMGLDDAFRPNLAVTDDLAVFSLSTVHAQRLLKEAGVEEVGPFKRLQKPLVSASGCNFVRLADLLDAWFQYALQEGIFEDLDTDEEIPLTDEELNESLATLFNVMRCLRGTRSVTYLEDGTTVTHGEVLFTDIPW